MNTGSTNEMNYSAQPQGLNRAAVAGTKAVVQGRDPRLDFYRGIAMFIILVAHVPYDMWALWIPARWGFSDATEMFVFCSGMASAIAFGGSFLRKGWIIGTARVLFRCWQVYWAHIGLFLAVATLMAAIDMSGVTDKNYMGSLNLWKFVADPGPQLVGLFTLTYVPNYFDILPMYLVILMMLPLVMALARIHLALVAVFVSVQWFFAQATMLEALGIGHLALHLPAEPWSDRVWFFNPFGWQLVFFTGFAFMRGWIPAPPVTRGLIWGAVAIVLLNIPLSDIGVREFQSTFAQQWRGDNWMWIAKSEFGILRYLQFLALAYLGYVIAGDGGHRLKAQGEGRVGLIWARFVVLVTKVGQQSLAIFLFSMFTAQVLGFVLDQYGRSAGNVWAVNLVGFSMMICVAYSVAWIKSQPWRGGAK